MKENEINEWFKVEAHIFHISLIEFFESEMTEILLLQEIQYK